MTTKSPANAAHDAARAEDARRAHAELHAHIDSLERQLRTRADVADHTSATLNEHLANAERRLAEVTRERDQARERLADALRDRDAADAAFAACARAAECVYEDGTLHDVRTTVAQIEQLVACANTRYTCAQLAAEDEAEAEHDRIAIAEEERDEARQQRDEAAKDAIADIHEAQEQGARWAIAEWWHRGLGDCVPARPEGFEEVAARVAARICAEARAKGGE